MGRIAVIFTQVTLHANNFSQVVAKDMTVRVKKYLDKKIYLTTVSVVTVWGFKCDLCFSRE